MSMSIVVCSRRRKREAPMDGQPCDTRNTRVREHSGQLGEMVKERTDADYDDCYRA